MKEAITRVKFFMTKNNMEFLLKGIKIDNLDDVRRNIFEHINTNGSIYVYEPRLDDPHHPDNRLDNTYKHIHTSEFPDASDEIIGKVLRFINGNNGDDSLEIEIINSLYFAKLREPCIKVNGYYSISSDGSIHIDKITRLTLADRNN